MRNILIFTFNLILTSCKQKERFIHYSYENATITRLDKENNSYLFYGKYENIDSLPKKYIKATYNGFDGLMSCYLLFEKNDKVEIVAVEGDFDTINSGDKMKLISFNENIDFIKWHEKMKANYNNTIELSDIVNLEIKRNKKNNSKVKAVYPENIE